MEMNTALVENTCWNAPLSGLCSLLTIIINVQRLQYRKKMFKQSSQTFFCLVKFYFEKYQSNKKNLNESTMF